jgi:hypothetical protein
MPCGKSRGVLETVQGKPQQSPERLLMALLVSKQAKEKRHGFFFWGFVQAPCVPEEGITVAPSLGIMV